MASRWCKKCKKWSEGRSCPKCGDESKFNKHLRTASLNSHLYDMANNVDKHRAPEVEFG